MHLNYARFLSITGIGFALPCLYAGLMNVLYYHYAFHSFVPFCNTLMLILIPYLIAIGLQTYYGYENQLIRLIKILCIGVFYFALIFMGASLVRLTPFQPVDKTLIQWDALFFIQVNHYTAYLQAHPLLRAIAVALYDGLSIEMVVIPLYVLIRWRIVFWYEYYHLVMITAAIGFMIYYFFPTVAPATAMGGEGFFDTQRATGIKFYELHQYVTQSTSEGGLIAFPSFHVIWAFLLTRMVRFSPVLFVLVLIYNVGLTFSCVLLGWHYGVDIIGSVLVLTLSYQLYRRIQYAF